MPHFDRTLQRDLRARAERAVKFLAASQRTDGIMDSALVRQRARARRGQSRPTGRRASCSACNRRLVEASRGRRRVAAARSAGCSRRRTRMAGGAGAARCRRRSRRRASCCQRSVLRSGRGRRRASDLRRPSRAARQWLIDATAGGSETAAAPAGPVLRPAVVLRGALPAGVRAPGSGSRRGSNRAASRNSSGPLIEASRLEARSPKKLDAADRRRRLPQSLFVGRPRPAL